MPLRHQTDESGLGQHLQLYQRHGERDAPLVLDSVCLLELAVRDQPILQKPL